MLLRSSAIPLRTFDSSMLRERGLHAFHGVGRRLRRARRAEGLLVRDRDQVPRLDGVLGAFGRPNGALQETFRDHLDVLAEVKVGGVHALAAFRARSVSSS